MVRVYRFRLYPNRVQETKLHETMELLRQLYNGVLQERRGAYQKQRITLSEYNQMRELKDVRVVCPEYQSIHIHLLQDAVTRAARAYKTLFRVIRDGKRGGLPRFKGPGRYRSFMFKDVVRKNGARLDSAGSRIHLSKIGHIKVKLHRPVEGTIQQIGVMLGGDGHWYTNVICKDVPVVALSKTGNTVGIDVGIRNFAALSDGTLVPNPRHYERFHPRIAHTQRTIAKRKRGSGRRHKMVELLHLQRHRMSSTRRDFHHKLANDLVRDFDVLSVEDLNLAGLVHGFAARQVLDAAWGSFIRILAYKAESAGRELVRVDPRGTSQVCSGCGERVPKGPTVQVHRCPYCGYTSDRDINAARNIQRLGHSLRGGMSGSSPVEPRSPYLAVCGR